MTTREVAAPERSRQVLEYLAEHPTASFRDISAELGIGRTTANRAVYRLIDENKLVVERMGTGDGYPTTYRVTA